MSEPAKTPFREIRDSHRQLKAQLRIVKRELADANLRDQRVREAAIRAAHEHLPGSQTKALMDLAAARRELGLDEALETVRDSFDA